MFLLVPYAIDSIPQRRPFANWAVVGVCVLAWLGIVAEQFPLGLLDSMVLFGWDIRGLVGYNFLHAEFFHLLGNMIFLWVFGNAICSNMNSFIYLGLFLLLGVFAGAVHLSFDGEPAIGASGAINGVIGMVMAIYPQDRVNVFWWFFVRFGTFEIPAWVLAVIWFAFDLLGTMESDTMIAYWAHIGGFLGGILAGLVVLQFGWIELTVHDKRTLLEIIKGEYPEDAM